MFALSDETFVDYDNGTAWSRGLPTNLYNLLNGRYNNIGQCNSPIANLSYTRDGNYFIEYEDEKLRYDGINLDIDDLEDFGGIESASLGPNDSYVIIGQYRKIWCGVPHRMDQLLRTRTQYEVKTAQLGYSGSYYLEYYDGARYWGGLPSGLVDLLNDKKIVIEDVVLDPDSYNYYCESDKGDQYWCGPTRLTNHLKADKHLSHEEIYYSNSSIKSFFSDGRSVFKLARELENGETHIEDIEMIRVLKVDGCYHSLDNRRLKAFSDAGVDSIPVQVVRASNSAIVKKIRNLPNEGCTIKIRN
mmetsp:Transcript_14011/g.21207  ORF Transcript_14011/g.21207 Transcript_14011/m.21207 type:complete len:302 (+) Transcript_14011:86-991(+)